MSDRAGLAAAMLLALAVRLPFFLQALRTPVDGDTAIVGLMARHVGHAGTTLWGQPYGSPLDAWVAAPFVAALGPTRAALRAPYLLLGLALVPLAFAVARCLHPQAGLPAAFLLACPPAYFLLLCALPPPLYPTTLALLAAVVLLTLAPRGRDVAWGALAGLAVWTHLMSVAIVVPCAVYLMRGRPWRRQWPPLVALLAASAPWWLRLFHDPSALWILRLSSEGEGLGQRLARLLGVLHRPLLALLGVRVPLVADDADRILRLPPWAAALLVLGYAGGLAAAVARARRQAETRLLLVLAALPVAAFPLSTRAGPEAVRFLTASYLPLAVAVVASVVALAGVRRAWMLVVGMSVLHLVLSARLAGAWRAAGPSDLVPDCAAPRRALEQLGIERAYASYNTAWCLTYESGESIVASQPFNERFSGYPLPLLDEVRFAHSVAWVLMPGMDFVLPSPKHFEGKLASIGGSWRKTLAGEAVVYHAFVPPFGPAVTPLASAGAAGDGNLDTRVTEPASGPTTFVLPQPTPLAALTLFAGRGDLRLPRNMTVEVSPDGATFERVARRRARREEIDLAWVNGHPQYVIDDDVLTVPLAGLGVAAIRITPAPPGEPWALEEVLLHAPAPAAPWDDWLAPRRSWVERRRALEAEPRRDREDWYYRSLLAARH
ncbi:MAG TPA: hypothetical protein VGQ78_01770 [Vicinamibacteria bacterium]|nr:hypothetical protein [Vicinamibacteria bacterium]